MIPIEDLTDVTLAIEDTNEDDDEDVHMDNVYKKDDLWRWKDGIIPYEFHQSKTFDQDFKDRIETVIKNINLNLSDCIHIR